MSAWPGRVGRPVEGPPRCTLTKTQGVSVMAASPMCSIISEKPGPRGDGHAFLPAQTAPCDRDGRGELVLHLDEHAAHVREALGDALDDLGRGRDRVAGDEAAARRQRALAAGVVAVEVVGPGQDASGSAFMASARTTSGGW
jgi:hypothetical protein